MGVHGGVSGVCVKGSSWRTDHKGSQGITRDRNSMADTEIFVVFRCRLELNNQMRYRHRTTTGLYLVFYSISVVCWYEANITYTLSIFVDKIFFVGISFTLYISSLPGRDVVETSYHNHGTHKSHTHLIPQPIPIHIHIVWLFVLTLLFLSLS